MPWNNRYNRTRTAPNPDNERIGFSGNNRTGEEEFVRNMRRTMLKSLQTQEADGETMDNVLGKIAEITRPSSASLKSAAVAGLAPLRRGQNARQVETAIAALRMSEVQELHLVDFDPEIDESFIYQANDEATAYQVVSRRGYFGPSGRPTLEKAGTIHRVLLGVGDDPKVRGNQPTGKVIRHNDWRKLTIEDDTLITAVKVNSFRIVGVKHVLASAGGREESELVFYVEVYSAADTHCSKASIPFPTMGEEEAPSDDEGIGSEDMELAGVGFDDEDPMS